MIQQTKYFTNDHFARDIVYSSSSFLIFVICFTILSFESEAILEVAHKVVTYEHPVAALTAILPSFFLVAICAGFISVGAFITARKYVCKLTGRPSNQFSIYYQKSFKEINELYDTYFQDISYLSSAAVDDETTMINRLLALFKQFNVNGFSHIYRMYSLISLFRQLFVYSLACGVVSGIQDLWDITAIALLLSIYFLERNNELVAQAVRMEYSFISATASGLNIQSKVNNDVDY